MAELQAIARAHANIALVKYWGKRDETLKLPFASSLSLCLDALYSVTEVQWRPGEDQLFVNGHAANPSALSNARRILDALRQRIQCSLGARIHSRNSFPTAAGLASSSSAFASLAAAACAAIAYPASLAELSALARLGSGSACRSVPGGWAQWNPGVLADGSDSFAEQLAPAPYWDLRVLVAIVDAGTKPLSSSLAMARCAQTSPFFAPYLESNRRDLAEALEALRDKDLAALGRVAERSCLRLHAANLAAEPPITFLQPTSWALIARVRALQASGLSVFFTADAGPNIKVFCLPDDEAAVSAALGAVPGVERLLVCRPAEGVKLLDHLRAAE